MRILLSILIVLIFCQDYSGSARLPLPEPPRIEASAVALFPGDPQRRRIGALTYLGGIELRERQAGGGGYSAIAVAGDRVTLLNDGGNLLGFRWRLPARIDRAWTRALPAGPGRGWRKKDRDSEAMTRDPASGTNWVAYEYGGEIWRYAPGFARATGSVQVPAMRRWPDNGGAESMVRLANGRFLVIAEQRPDGWRPRDTRPALLFAGDPVSGPHQGFRFGYRPPSGFRPVDAAELPDGRILVLNRRFVPPFRFEAKLVVLDREAIRPGAIIRGRELATLAPPALHDNFEGVAVTREKGATMLWLVSDDNQLFLQRTLLLKFRLDERAPE